MNHIGLSLGGGSLKGAAHIGVLKVLEQENINITHLAGTSVGSIIAGLFASGISPKQMEELLKDLSFRKLFDISLTKSGFIKGHRLYEMLLKLTDGKHFKDLDIPLNVISLDLNSRQLVTINSGEIAKAIKASIAIPGIFTPVKIDNQLLVDGYILNNNPANIVKEMGAEHVIAINLWDSNHNEMPCTNHLISNITRYMRIASEYNTRVQVEQYADTVIDINLKSSKKINLATLTSYVRVGEKQIQDSLFPSRVDVEKSKEKEPSKIKLIQEQAHKYLGNRQTVQNQPAILKKSIR